MDHKSRTSPQPLDLCLLSPAISAYSAVRRDEWHIYGTKVKMTPHSTKIKDSDALKDGGSLTGADQADDRL